MRWVLLQRQHPELAYRSCDDCKEFVYGHDGTIVKEGGKPVKRPFPPECTACEKWEAFGDEEPSEWVKDTYEIWLVCKKLGTLPGPGCLGDQDRRFVNAARELAITDEFEEKACLMIKSALSSL